MKTSLKTLILITNSKRKKAVDNHIDKHKNQNKVYRDINRIRVGPLIESPTTYTTLHTERYT